MLRLGHALVRRAVAARQLAFVKLGRSKLVNTLRPFATSGGAGGGGSGGLKPTGGNGSGGGGNGGGLAAVWLAYMRLMDSHPTATKLITAAALNGLGDVLGQRLFEKDKPFDWLRFSKFVLLGGLFVAPVLGFWYGKLNQIIPAQTTGGAIGRLVLDQLCFSPVFISAFIALLCVLDGAPDKIAPKLRQDLWPAVRVNWTIWVPAQFLNFRYVQPQYQLLCANCVALVWNTFLSYQANREVVLPPPEVQAGRRA